MGTFGAIGQSVAKPDIEAVTHRLALPVASSLGFTSFKGTWEVIETTRKDYVIRA